MDVRATGVFVMEKVILVTSGKGGTGKTMFSVNLGGTLANCGRRVLLIDMDLGMRNMDLYLGMENKVVFNIMDVMTGICGLNKALIKVDGFDSLYFMAASPRKGDARLTPQNMIALCGTLSKYFDHIIIDTGAGIDELVDASAAAAETAVIVTEPEIAALRDADTVAAHLRDLGIYDVCMVVNNVDMDLVKAGILMDVESIMNCTSTPVIGLIQSDRDIRISTCTGKPLERGKREDTKSNIRTIAGRLIPEG